jgi:hypothetical protein
MKRKYHIFRIEDYRGGYLRYEINLTKKEFIFELYYLIQDDDYPISKMTEEELAEYIGTNISDWAGRGSFTFDAFKTRKKDNKLVSINIYEFLSDIIEIAKQEEQEEQEEEENE